MSKPAIPPHKPARLRGAMPFPSERAINMAMAANDIPKIGRWLRRRAVREASAPALITLRDMMREKWEER